jgi:hypothetical protein
MILTVDAETLAGRASKRDARTRIRCEYRAYEATAPAAGPAVPKKDLNLTGRRAARAWLLAWGQQPGRDVYTTEGENVCQLALTR